MAAQPINTQQTTISVDDGSGNTAVVINGVMSISDIGSGSASEKDVTTLASTQKETRPGLPDFGTMQMEMIWNLDDAGQAELLEMYLSQAVRQFVVTLPATNPTLQKNIITFNGWVQTFPFNIGADDVVRGTCSVRITSAPAYS